ncbi:MAG: UDP-N-acetylglucosamine--N-acetylmuramyl-(pentapeptide) pyrophosphoryl-undecaprenol N-acetylglucosamine transferase [Clostridia bacterium]|nr:UDP-N-acetylglucosamine--N-acetylmuramyl-(pentapeptide) pyrophosphoryl-undecaprenol N-acetylglucosamine transferase [Clostridia bacterium]MDD4685988.1 UDP-N-acetylglucosamine--N-acetylmuramyl-(pentapeptide) pyrophosphoryl-undecaprenol N-acetylglucosamine transferase [Clostridia bacterium]
MKRIVLTGGGTAGHIIPHIALIPYLSSNFEIYYLGNKNGMEYELLKDFKNIKFVETQSVKLIRKITLKNLLIPFKLISYIKKTKTILKDINPNVIFAKGGAVSVPVVYAGKSLQIPILAHESDFSLGLANKLILRKCEIMFTSFRDTCINDKCVYSGSPIRKEIFKGKKEIAEKICNFEKVLPVVMIFGGSLGAKRINDFIFENLDNLTKFNIIHIVGKNNLNGLKQGNYFQIEYAKNIYDYFALADVVACRAGSNSIFELLALKKPMILIPLAKKQSRGDQIENAEAFKKNGYAKVILEKDLTISNLKNKINFCLKNKDKIKKKMKSYKSLNTNKLIIDYILDYAEDGKLLSLKKLNLTDLD